MTGRQRDEGRRERLREAWGKVSVKQFADAEQTSPGAIYRLARQMGLETRARISRPLRDSHQAIRTGRTRFPNTVISAKKSMRALIEGKENQKLGQKVTKGRWAGLFIKSLTLEERATCPVSCEMWKSCYGNNLHLSRRHILDHELRKRLDVEIDMQAARHSGGFLVRLHVLGDFGRNMVDGEPYVRFWAEKMRETPGMHLFGFTAHQPDSRLGGLIMFLLNEAFPDRCRIRFSGSGLTDGYGAAVIDRLEDSRHVVCPFETDHPKAPKDCGSCGLCWTMDRPVEFLRH